MKHLFPCCVIDGYVFVLLLILPYKITPFISLEYNIYLKKTNFIVSSYVYGINLDANITALEERKMKKIIIATLACLFLFGGQAFAHTGLESSNPTNGSVVSEALKEITLTFESKIEQTSSFELVNANNEKVHVTNLTVSENVMTGTIDESIENGAYKILWKIIGVDGHLINGEIPFTLDAPVVEETQEEISAPDAESEVLETPKEETPKEEATAVESKEDSNNGLIGVIIAIVVVLAGSVWWMSRRKSK